MTRDEALGVGLLDTADRLRAQLDGTPDDEMIAVRADVLRGMADLLDGYGRRLIGIEPRPNGGRREP